GFVHRTRRRRDADRLAPVDVVVDAARRLLAPLLLAGLLRLVLRLALQLLGALVGAKSRHGWILSAAFVARSRGRGSPWDTSAECGVKMNLPGPFRRVHAARDA